MTKALGGTGHDQHLRHLTPAPDPARPVTRPGWRHNDRERALGLLRAHLGTDAEARAALAVIEAIADPSCVTLESWVREAAPRRAVRPLLAAGRRDGPGA